MFDPLDQPILAALQGVAERLVAAHTLEDLALCLEHTIEQFFPVEYVGIVYREPGSRAFRLLHSRGFTEQEALAAERTAADRHPGWVFEHGKPLRIDDTENPPEGIPCQDSPRSTTVRSRVFMPVLVQGKVVAAVGVASSQPHAFSDLHVSVLSFLCSLASSQFENIELLGDLQHDIERREVIEQELRRTRDELDQKVEQRTKDLRITNETLAWEVSVRRAAENALRESNQLLAAVVNSSPIAIIACDLDSRVKMWNPAAELMYGWLAREVVGRPNPALGPDAESTLRDLLDQLIADRRVHDKEARWHHRDGSVVEVALSMSMLRSESGRPSGLVFLTTDIRARKSAEEERQRLEEQLRQSQKMEALGRLAGGVAHDINNVLTSIMGLTAILESEMPSASSDLKSIQASCKRGGELTRNLLGFARKGRYRQERFSLNTVVEEVVGLLGRTMPRTIAITTNLSAELPQILGDASQINHAIMNVCINAVDAMGDQGSLALSTDLVHVTQRSRAELEPGSYVRLRVADNGVGMIPEVKAHVFEPFFTTKPSGRGTGLGLSMVYGTIKNHRGDVTIDSEQGKGTTVTILLRGADDQTISDRPAPRAQPLRVAEGSTVLLVDDEPLILYTGKRLLQRMGYSVLVASDGKQAVELFAEHHPTITGVVLDLIMPVMDGAEAFVRMREIDPSVRVLLSSGYSRDGVAEHLLAAGAAGFLQKPFDQATLAQSLQEALGR